MKKGILFGVVCAAVLFISTFVACNSNEPQLSGTNPSNDDPYVELMQNLDDFHADYMANHPSEGSRGFRDFFRKLKNCVRADFYGSRFSLRPFVITIILSPSASYEGWINGYSIASQDEYDECTAKLIQNENLLCQINDLSSDEGDSGYLHNKILIELFKRCTPNDSYIKVVKTAVKIYAELTNIKVSANDAKVMISDLKDFMENVVDESDDVMAERMKVRFPQKANEIDVMKNYFVNIQNLNSIEEVHAYTLQYKAIIDASKISDSERMDLVSSIGIAPASMELWSKVITED